MHVIVTTDGSHQSLTAAQFLKGFADPSQITELTVVAVLSPLAAVPFANELSGRGAQTDDPTNLSFRDEAQTAVDIVAAEFDQWGPKVSRQLLSGSPAAEIVKLADLTDAGLIVMASGSAGLSPTIMLGSTAQRVQHSAHCPVLIGRQDARRR
jgi:nucleotide-binding universal stress UspA family protein